LVREQSKEAVNSLSHLNTSVNETSSPGTVKIFKKGIWHPPFDLIDPGIDGGGEGRGIAWRFCI
jgi:hypothetical protein